MNVLGLDLSINSTGIAHPNDLFTFTPRSAGDHRLHEIRDRLVRLLPDIDLVVIEGPVLRSQSALALGMLHGAVRVALISHQTPYLVVPPATLKTYATGVGNASKTLVVAELVKRTDSDVVPADDNQADAWWLAAIGYDLAGYPPLDLPKNHRRALNKLALPKGTT